MALAKETLREIDRLLENSPTADIARRAWHDYGEITSATAMTKCLPRPIASPLNTCR
jgi:histidinol dehydrogenase